MISTATVETLTARVHVLQVGNRQVTVGVMQQLDTVHWYELEPFGRFQSGAHMGLIGKRITDGTLVKSAFPPGEHSSYRMDESDEKLRGRMAFLAALASADLTGWPDEDRTLRLHRLKWARPTALSLPLIVLASR